MKLFCTVRVEILCSVTKMKMLETRGEKKKVKQRWPMNLQIFSFGIVPKTKTTTTENHE